ncbi:unnamed protein product [Camellia sinensis]
MVFKHMDSFMDIEEILATLQHEGMRLPEILASLEREDLLRLSFGDTNSQLPSPGCLGFISNSSSKPDCATQSSILGEIWIHISASTKGQTARDGNNFPLINGGSYVGPNHHVAPSSGPPKHKPAKKSHKSYSVADGKNLVLEVAIHGQKWKSIIKSFPGRSEEQLKQKWKDVMEKAGTKMTGTKMDENKKRLHIFAAVVHVNTKKESTYKQKFQKWFEEMGKEDQEIKAYAENWLREVRKIGKLTAELNQARLWLDQGFEIKKQKWY